MLDREQEDIASITKQHLIQLSPSSSNDDTNASTFVLPTSSKNEGPSTPQLSPKKLGRKQLFNDNLALSFDVAKLSELKATVILTTTLQSISCDPSIYNINHYSVIDSE